MEKRGGDITATMERRPAAQKVFLRGSTGLVREMKWQDAIFINLLNMSVGVGAAWLIFWGPGIYPESNVVLGVVLTGVACFFGMYCFATLTASMPRSGGDYVFVSRCLHPSLGFASSWTWVIMNVIWCGILGTWVVTWGLRDLFGMLGVVRNDLNLIDWSVNLSQPDHPVTFTISAMIVVLSGVMLTLGLKVYFRIQAACALIGLAMLIVAAAVFANTSNAEFEAVWNAYAEQQGAFGYDTTTLDAPSVYPWYDWSPEIQTLGIMPIAFWVLGYPYFSAFLGGEMRRPKSTAFIGNIGALSIGFVLILLLWVLVSGTLGKEFIIGTYGQSYGYTNHLPEVYDEYFMPSEWFDFMAGICSGNIVVIHIMGIGMIAWLLMYPALCYLGQTRSVLAWSLDRIAPSWFGKVSEKWHAPVNALAFFIVVNLAYLVVYAKTFDYLTSYSATLGQVLGSFMLVGISAIMLPYRRSTRRLYEASGVKHRLAGVPMTVIAGAIWVVFLLVIAFFLLYDPNLGANDYWSDLQWGVRFLSLFITAGIWISGFGLYWATRWYKRKQGIDIDQAFSQLPPE